MTTNQIIITNIDTGKTYTEEQLADLLRDEGVRHCEEQGASLRYFGTEGWHISYHYSRDYRATTLYALNSSRFSISFANQIERSKVREMIKEMRLKLIDRAQWPKTNWADHKEGIDHVYHYKDDPYKTISEIASRYLDTE